MTILKSIEEDSKDEIGVNVEDGELKTISDLALKQSQLEEKVSEKESELKSIKQELKEIAEVQLPEALQEVGVSEFSLVDGTKVSVTPFYSARITTDNKEEAFDWHPPTAKPSDGKYYIWRESDKSWVEQPTPTDIPE